MAQTLHDYFKTKYTADVVGLYGGQSQHGSPVKPPLVDALGRPVPEEYREAYELLAQDERRVCVTPGPTSIPWGTRRLMWTIWERTPGRDGAPCVEAPEMTHFQQAADGMSIADAARLALAMEAERLGKTEPANDDAIAEAAEARRAAAAKPADPMQGRTRCLRCGGDAGFLGLSCQRVGGCKTKSERVAALVPDWCVKVPSKGGEIIWQAGGAGPQAVYVHPTRDGAISLWRTAMAERMGE